MELKNDCERNYIKEAFDKLYNCVMPFVDLTQFSNADTAFKELDRKVHSEIYILKKCLAERDRAVDEVYVPWSDGPYMYVKSGMMYNPRTERLVYVGKDQHLKWFGEKFSIV